MSRTSQNRVAQFIVVALTTLTAGTSLGATANLDALFTGSYLDLGSVMITNFGQTNSTTSGLGQAIDPAQVVVNATLVGNKVEVDFIPFIGSATGGGTVDFDFTFMVVSNAGISAAQLVQIGGGSGATSFVEVDETISYSGGSMSLMTSDTTSTAATALPNPTSITVEKQINIRSDNSSAQISGLRQAYILVPEPNAMGLAMLALVGCLGGIRKKRRRE